MTKRILLAAFIFSLGVLPACRPPACPTCTDCGWAPNSSVTIFYPTTPVTTSATAIANSQGCIVFDSKCIDCSRMSFSGRRRSGFFGLFSVSPDPINLQSPPGSLTIYGYGISAAYGAPTIECIDPYGRRISTTTATAVAGDGSWVQINLPDLSQAYTGQFQVLVINRTWDGIQEEMALFPD